MTTMNRISYNATIVGLIDVPDNWRIDDMAKFIAKYLAEKKNVQVKMVNQYSLTEVINEGTQSNVSTNKQKKS